MHIGSNSKKEGSMHPLSLKSWAIEVRLKEIEKLEFINQLALPEQHLSSLNSKIMSRIRSRAFFETVWELKHHPTHIRYVFMSVFFYTRRSEIIDE